MRPIPRHTMTAGDLKSCSQAEAETLTREALALWHVKKGNWDQAHDIAQDIHTPTGSWIHALIHVIEGDQGNGNYWFSMAGKPSRRMSEVDALWDEIAATVLAT